MIRRLTRAPGRHRDGRPRTAVHKRLWDGPARAEADRLGLEWPGWLVLYSLGTRRFYAIAGWASEPLMVADDTAEGLEARMHDAETAFTRRALPAPSPSTSRRGGISSPASAAAPQSSRRPYRDAA